jgi:hypothetical protein
MDASKQRFIAYVLTAVFLLVGVVGYAAFPVPKPETPVRLMLLSEAAGNVFFDHKEHSDPAAYGLSCRDCHHIGDMDTSASLACGDCHDPDYYSEEDFDPSLHREHFEDFGLSCTECHFETLPKERVVWNCGTCHTGQEDGYASKRDEAFHQQCMGCHEDKGGPVDCSMCHVM